ARRAARGRAVEREWQTGWTARSSILLRVDASHVPRSRLPSDLAPGICVPDTVTRPHRLLTGFPLDNREIHRNVSFLPVPVNVPRLFRRCRNIYETMPDVGDGGTRKPV